MTVTVGLLGFCATWAVNKMQKKLISALLVLALALVTATPPKVAGQSLARPEAEPGTTLIEPTLPAPATRPKPDLRKSFATEVAKIKAGALTEADLKRLEKEQQAPQSDPPTKTGWTRRKKLLVALLIVVATGAVVVAIKHRCKDRPAKPCPEIDSSDSDF